MGRTQAFEIPLLVLPRKITYTVPQFTLSYKPESVHLELGARSEKQREKQSLTRGREQISLCSESSSEDKHKSSFKSSLETNEEERGTWIYRENAELGEFTKLLIRFIALSSIPDFQVHLHGWEHRGLFCLC